MTDARRAVSQRSSYAHKMPRNMESSSPCLLSYRTPEVTPEVTPGVTHEADPVGRMFTCKSAVCRDVTFKRLAELKRHIRDIHGGEDTLLQCPAPGCNSMKRRKDKLKEHIKKVHKSPHEKVFETQWFASVDKAARAIRHSQERVAEDKEDNEMHDYYEGSLSDQEVLDARE
jgi:hypothetical protein